MSVDAGDQEYSITVTLDVERAIDLRAELQIELEVQLEAEVRI